MKQAGIKLDNGDDYTVSTGNITDNAVITINRAMPVTVEIDGDTKVYIPQGIQSGEKIKIPSKGYKDGKGGRGDLVAEVKIMVPKKLELDEKEMFEKLKDMSAFNPRND